jgi:ribosomal-protein-alanine N-acetyltransferase
MGKDGTPSSCRSKRWLKMSNALRLQFTPFPEIKTSRLVLRQITQGDLKEIFFLRTDPQVLTYINKVLSVTMEDAADWIKRMEEAVHNNASIIWGMTEKGKQEVIGTICLFNIKTDQHRAEAGYALHPAHQYKGYMSEALEAVVNYGFKLMNLHSIEANVNPANIASINLLQKNKFVREAYFKENWFFNGQYLDTAVYSILAPKKDHR